MVAHELTGLEQRVRRAAVTGELVDLQVGDEERDSPANGSTWDESRTIRAEWLVSLLCGEQADAPRPRAVCIRGARIAGELDLEASALACPLFLHGCLFEEPVNLNEATAPVIRLPGCHLPGLSAKQLRTSGNLELNSGFTANDQVRLQGARIGGYLDLRGAHLTNPRGWALNAEQVTVDMNVFCQEGFTAEGEVRFGGARIAGQLNLDGAHLANPGGPAFTADMITVGQAMSLANGFTAEGQVRLPAAHISGELNFSGARLVNPGDIALQAGYLTVDQHMNCRDGFTAEGQVHLLGARIGGQLNLRGAHLANPGKCALNADWLTAGYAVFCTDGFTADGEIRFPQARISGQFDLTGAHLTNAGGNALFATGLTVEQSMFCRNGFTAAGRVDLTSTHIGDQLDFTGAHLANPGATALSAEALTARFMLCRSGFTASGSVALPGTQISDQLAFDNASLEAPGTTALHLEAAQVGDLVLMLTQPPAGSISLINAKVGVFRDDRKTWPAALSLRGFTYDVMATPQISVRDRLHWLTRDTAGFFPQVYDQLAAAYQRTGHLSEARRVAICKQWRQRSRLSPLNWLMYATVGYGYRTWLAAVWLAALAMLGTRVFTLANARHLMQASPGAPAFHPIAYALDLVVPVINLGQRNAYTPQGWALPWSWILICAGWILTTAVVTALTGVLSRN